MTVEGWAALALAFAGLSFAFLNDPSLRIAALAMFAAALALAMVAA